ncbi:MAG TPA: peptidase, partial [Bacteroidales bacterium]|nr:peptidase [Bacteroidales bacterium]
MNFRKIVRITHRDLGYFFFAMTLIYALSGIGMNHLES